MQPTTTEEATTTRVVRKTPSTYQTVTLLANYLSYTVCTTVAKISIVVQHIVYFMLLQAVAFYEYDDEYTQNN